MKFTVNNKTYFVKWDYFTDKGETMTLCKLYDENTDYMNPIDTATAICKPTDRFCKNTGRKISLTRLLNIFPKHVRTIAWQEYFKESPKRLK